MTIAVEIPGYVVGTWDIDTEHSEIGFTIRHMMVTKVHGKFRSFNGEFTTAENPLESRVAVRIDLESIDTGNGDRDNHLRSSDFFDIESNKVMTYQSTEVRIEDGDYVLVGDLTLKGVTKPVELQVELGGFGPDPFGGTRSGFTATGEIRRSEFGVDFNPVLETGGVVLGDKVAINIEIEGILRRPEVD